MKKLSCQYILNCINSNLSRKRRNFYIFFILIIVLLERSYEIIRKYQKHPTYIETHFVPQYHASFPAITVCALHGYKSKVLEVKIYFLYFLCKIDKILFFFSSRVIIDCCTLNIFRIMVSK